MKKQSKNLGRTSWHGLTKRLLVPGFFISLVVFSLCMQLLGVGSVYALVDPGTPTEPAVTAAHDMQRRRLYTLKECLADNKIDDDDDITDFADVFTDEGNKEVILAGFDRQRNGVMGCQQAVLEGWATFGTINTGLGRPVTEGSSEADIINSFMQALTFQNFLDSPDGIDNDVNMDQQREAIIDSINEILARPEYRKPPDNDILRKQRIFERYNLVDTCYDVEDAADSTRTLGGNDFEVTIADGTDVRLFLKDPDDIQNAFKDSAGGWVKLNGGTFSATNAEIGDYELSFSGQRGDANDFNSDSSDFYPVGTDLGVFGRGVLDCNFVKDHKVWLEQDVVFSDGTLSLDADGDGEPDDPGEGDQSRNGCEETLRADGGSGWIICPALRVLDGLINDMINAIVNLLEFDDSDFNDDEGNLQQAWSYFRNIASFALIIIGLAMVIGQSVSKE